MAVTIQGEGALSWDASIGTDQFEDSIKLIINGLEKTAKTASDAAKAQNDAFAATADGLSDAARKAQEMQKAFDGFTDAKTKIRELNAEIARMKAPDFINTDQGKALESRGQTLAYLNQQEKMLEDLQVVAENYKKQLIDLSGIEVKAPQVQVPQVDNIAGVIGTQVIEELKKSFGEIDAPTQKFIQNLIDLELRLQHLQQSEQDLASAFNEGKITEKEYADTQAFLMAGIKAVNDETVKLTDKQKEYQASLQQSNGSIDEKKAALTNLKNAYTALSEAQRNSPEGESMLKGIRDLSNEIKGLEPGKLVETKADVVSIRTELQQLTEQMARNPESPLFDEWKKKAAELKESLKGVKTGIEQATNSTAGIEAFASGLRGLVGGFTAATGVIGLFTDDTEEVEKVTKNAASALALLNGIQEISNVLQKTSALNVYLLGLMHKANAASTVVETAATEANTIATGANTAATVSQAAATEGAALAQRSLTAAMLANPAGLVIAGIAALAAAYLVLSRRQNEVKSSSDLLAEANKKVNNSYAERMAAILPLVEAVKEGNLTEEQSIAIHKQLQEADESLVKGLNAKRIAYDDLIVNVNAYSDSLRNQFRLEANKEAITQSIKQEEEINKKLRERQKIVDDTQKFSKSQTGVSPLLQSVTNENNRNAVDKLTEALEKQKAVTNELVTANVSLTKSTLTTEQKGKLAQINAEIAAKRKEREEVSNTSAEYAKFSKELKVLEDQRRQITGETEKSKTSTAGENRLLREQQSLLETIASLKRGADQSGLTKEASELDKINEKYDQAIKKIEEFNKKAPKSLRIDPAQLNAPRQTELDNATAKQNLSDYKKSLSDQQKVFDDFEKAKVDIGEARAKELFAAQIKSADSYLDYLKKQQVELQKVATNSTNNAEVISAQLALKANAEAQVKENDKLAKKQLDTEVNNLKTLLTEVVTYNDKKLAINKHYDDLEKTAKNDKSATEEETKALLAIIKQGREDSLTDLNNNVKKQEGIYRKLGEDMTFFMADQLKERAAVLQEALLDPKLSPATKAAVKSLVDQINQLLHETDPISIKTLEAADKFSAIANGLNDISSSLSGIDNNLSKIIGTVGNLSGAVSSSLRNLDLLRNSTKPSEKINAGFGIFGAFFGVVGAINGMINGAARRRAELKAQEDAQMLAIQQGEVSINDEYRKRLLLQAQLNKLKLEGLKAESDALQNNQQGIKEDFQTILNLIQTQGRAIPQGFNMDVIKILQNFAPNDPYLKAFNEAASLAGKSFDDLQKLFLTGQLDDKAKALFQTLQSLKDQGVDIDAQIQKNAEDAKQIFTGTTSESILDSIVQGFADGKRASADFADDFEKLMKQSILNSLKYQALEKPIQELFDRFAADAQSDNTLTQAEIENLQAAYNATIDAAGKQFKQLQQITGLNFNTTDNTNSLSGAIKGITQQQADLLAGQFGGLRMTAFDQLTVAKSNLNILNQIANNTSLLIPMESYLRYFKTNGIKVQ